MCEVALRYVTFGGGAHIMCAGIIEFVIHVLRLLPIKFVKQNLCSLASSKIKMKVGIPLT